MKDNIDSLLGSKAYLNAVDPVTAGLETVTSVANLGSSGIKAVTKPDMGKYVAQRCGRKSFGYLFNKKKRNEFKECAQKATDDWNKQYNTTTTTITQGDTTKSLGGDSKTNTILMVGFGVIALGLLSYIALKK